MMRLTFATRSYSLARWQTARVIQLLQAAHPGLECNEYVIPVNSDDQSEDRLLSGKVQATVHSLKDLPVESTRGITVAAIPERETASDVLVSADGQRLSDLPEGARIGTNSLR